jgi:nucleotide-binding universal stress UspA family protein
VEKIVLGFDGGETSFAALDWVAERAAGRPTRVEVVMVGGTLRQSDRSLEAALLEAERRLRDCAPKAEIDVQQVIGKSPDSLVERASGADLLVVGSHRGGAEWSPLTRWMPRRVTSRSLMPVAVVPDDWEANGGKVIVGVDADESSRATVDFAAREAALAQVPLTLVHTWRMPAPWMEGSVALHASPIEERAVHRRILRAAEERARITHLALVVEQVLEQTDPTSAILRAARDASLVVLGTHHRGMVEGAFLGSVGSDVLTRCRAPVCIIPADS